MITQRVLRLWHDFRQKMANTGRIPVVYFRGRPNVGDLLNEYLIPRISGNEIFHLTSNWFPHLRAIGSVVGSASRNSYIWGSGSIDGAQPNRPISPHRIFALRGQLTRDLLSDNRDSLAHIPLGDPALLMPLFFRPLVETKHRVGIVPHFSDEGFVAALLGEIGEEVHVVEVGQEPEAFVRDLLSCQFILSSSLHGLILSDAYGIPNKWVKFSDRLLGGKFKFMDYYSVTSAVDEDVATIDSHESLQVIIRNITETTSVKRYLSDTTALIASFPKTFTRSDRPLEPSAPEKG